MTETRQVAFTGRNQGHTGNNGHARVFASATVRMPGTCGELVQGQRRGEAFMLTCPVDLYSTVTVELTECPGIICPLRSPKAGAAVRAALAHFGERCGARISIKSDLPRGKGMASSTADVAGAIVACSRALGREVDAHTVASLALSVEPSDGVMFSGIVVFDHRRGTSFEPVAPAPQMEIVVLDFGGEVDTVAFNRTDRTAILARLEPATERALDLARRGIRTGRLELVGEGATLSALANQEILPKPELPLVLEYARKLGALGVNVGHSGTCIGLLLDPAQHDPAEVAERARRELPGLALALPCRLVDGGARED